MTTEKSPRSRFEVPGMDEADQGKPAPTGDTLASISQNASLDEETNIPGSDPVPPPEGLKQDNPSGKDGGRS